MNILEAYRQSHDLTFEALAVRAGEDKTSVWRHCHAKRIPAEAVTVYEGRLGIPRWMLRPDLWPAPKPAADQPPEAA